MLRASREESRTILLTAAGISLAQIVHIAYSLLAGHVLPGAFLTALNIVGCMYLCYMGLMTIKYAKSGFNDQRASFRNGFFINLFNGKVVAYFAAIFPPLTSSLSVNELGMVIAGVTAMVLTWFTLVGLIGKVKAFESFLKSYKTKLDYCFGTLFIALGASLFYSTFI